MGHKRPNIVFIMTDDHAAHAMSCYGSRTHRHKLTYYCAEALGASCAIDDPRPPEWELFDLDNDPMELCSAYGDPAYADVAKELKAELHRLQAECGDQPVEEEG